MKFQTKQLSGADLDLLKALLDLFGEEFDEPDTYKGNRPDDRYLLELLCSDNFIAINVLTLASSNGARVLGC